MLKRPKTETIKKGGTSDKGIQALGSGTSDGLSGSHASRLKSDPKPFYFANDFIETIAFHYWDTWFKRKVPKGQGKMKREYLKLKELIDV